MPTNLTSTLMGVQWMSEVVLLGAPCESTGHPSLCTEPATGTVTENNISTAVRINGTVVANHNDSMHFPSHGHGTNDEPVCVNYQTHNLTPTQTSDVKINGKRVMQNGDTQTDPGSGGTATIIESGGNSSVTIHD